MEPIISLILSALIGTVVGVFSLAFGATGGTAFTIGLVVFLVLAFGLFFFGSDDATPWNWFD